MDRHHTLSAFSAAALFCTYSTAQASPWICGGTDIYNIDPARSHVDLTVTAFDGLVKFMGAFESYRGEIGIDQKHPARDYVSVTVFPASIVMNNKSITPIAQSIFAAVPEMTYRSRKVTLSDTAAEVLGELSVGPRSAPLSLSVQVQLSADRSFAGISTDTVINTPQFGLKVPVGVSENVPIRISAKAVRTSCSLP